MSASSPLLQEPELQEVMKDPIVRLIMERDGVKRETLEPLLKAAVDRLEGTKQKAA